MKKLVINVCILLSLTSMTIAQDSNSFDKKFRFGIRITPQPTWIKSSDKNASNGGLGFGFGFGLITEFKLSDIIHFSTGIGGDFENGTINFRNDLPNNYSVGYVTDKDGYLVEAANGVKTTDYLGNANVQYSSVTSRKIKTTYVSIPFTLKMLTQEYSGFRYFAQFGGELGIRTKIKATDTYQMLTKNGISTTGTGTNSDIDISKDASLIPLRLGLNVGAGTEYRIAGSTSIVFSVNYFTSFINLMKSESKYLSTSSSVDSNSQMTFTYLKQSVFQNAIRINIGFLF